MKKTFLAIIFLLAAVAVSAQEGGTEKHAGKIGDFDTFTNSQGKEYDFWIEVTE